MNRYTIIGSIVTVALLWGTVLHSSAAVQEKDGNAYGFSFEITDSEGEKKATISGKSAHFLPDGKIALTNMKAVLHRETEVEITTKEAFFDKSREEVTTREFVEIISVTMHIAGVGGVWNAVSNEVTLYENVKVVLFNQESEPETVITGDGKLNVLFQKDVASVYDNVVIKNQDGEMKADEAQFFFIAKGSDLQTQIDKMYARGHVKIFFEDKIANSGQAEYSVTAGKLVLTENPRIKQGDSLYTAEKITIYPKEDRVEFEPNAQLIIDY